MRNRGETKRLFFYQKKSERSTSIAHAITWVNYKTKTKNVHLQGVTNQTPFTLPLPKGLLSDVWEAGSGGCDVVTIQIFSERGLMSKGGSRELTTNSKVKD
jgi:hypothetical protein